MNHLSYSLKQPHKVAEQQRYRRSELETMTTHQLREICRREKIIDGVLHPLDKDELMHVILRYRGAEEEHLIQNHDPEGFNALQAFLMRTSPRFNTDYQLDGSATITAYEGLATTFYDQITMRYDARFEDTNALVVSEDREICGIFNIRAKGKDQEQLFLVKDKSIICQETENRKNYYLYCFDQPISQMLQAIYEGDVDDLPEQTMVYRMRILDFAVRKPQPLQLPLAIDFGTTNTVAGAYLDNTYFDQSHELPGTRGLREDVVNYALYYDTSNEYRETVLLPSVVAVRSLENEKPEYLFGYEAIAMMNTIYTDEGFSIFYDIKRWIADYDKEEELTDRQGRQLFLPRKELIRAFLEYVIEKAQDRFKCTVPAIHLSCPVKQKYLFSKLIDEILPNYEISLNETLEEGVTVLYNTISERIEKGGFENGRPQKALIIDCGGGTTDLCSCTYTIRDNRVSYDIDIETTFENGDTNFGGNNLTYRIMQLLKLEIAQQFGNKAGVRDILQGFDSDVFRYVDEHGTMAVYHELDKACEEAEAVFPTCFRYFDKHNRTDYFRVKENYYYMFHLAERIKKVFFDRVGILQVQIGGNEAKYEPSPRDKEIREPSLAARVPGRPAARANGSDVFKDEISPRGMKIRASEESVRVTGRPAFRAELTTVNLPMDKWKLSVLKDGRLQQVEDCPEIRLNIYDIELLLRADIYGIISKFLEPMYENEQLYDYNSIKLSGQSCKIGLFADAIKEFIPGKIIQMRKVTKDMPEQDRLHMKLSCVEGALQYLKDKKYGYANVTINSGHPALPYEITATNHHGKPVTLIHRLDRNRQRGTISRNMDNLTFKLFLNDADGAQRHSYTYQCQKSDFVEVTYEELQQRYPFIEQDETDVITEQEAKFFVWADTDYWGFHVLPVTRKQEGLRIGKSAFYPFENDSWVTNFFDGTH